MSHLFRSHRRRATLVAFLCATALTSCSNGGGGETTTDSVPPPSFSAPPGTGPGVITIANYVFSPEDLPVAPGATVTVVNQDPVTHTVTADTGGTFDTGEIPPGGTSTFTAPSVPGAVSYHCGVHPFMTGSLTVG